MLIDLQLHSTYSDGYLTPTQLAKFIALERVKVASLTDHNTVRGIHEFKFACCQYGIKVINGLELYTRLGGRKFNLLWYNFNENNAELHDVLRNSQIRRRGQVRKSLERLVALGFKINIGEILDQYHNYIPLNQVTEQIRENKYNQAKIKRELNNKTPRELDIIMAYFKNRQIGKLSESYISFERIIKLRKKVGGQLILNHPAKHDYVKKDFWIQLKQLGLDGVEVLSPHHSIHAILYIQQLAKELNFIETGGSDFHRVEGGKHPIQKSWDYFKIDSKYLRGIKKIIG